MRILQIASEAFPLVKTGGLADVASGLSQALVSAGDDVRLLLPAYPGLAQAAGARTRFELGDPLGVGPVSLLEGQLPGTDVTVWLVHCPALYDRPGGPYLDAQGRDHHDSYLRFALLSRVGALLATAGPLVGWTPDVVHAHDWQAGLTPAYLSQWGGPRPATVFSVHNLHFQGCFDASVLPSIAVAPHTFAVNGLEFYGSASYMKAGLYYADHLTTVSPKYAAEIQSEGGGEGLHGLLHGRAHELTGIVNGIDEQLWNPATDIHLESTYTCATLDTCAANKVALQRELGLDPDPLSALVGSVGRLTWQKGVDLLLQSLPSLLRHGAQLAVLGSGDGALEEAVAQAARATPGRVAFYRGYNESLSHRVIAGSDILAVPSRFEPCGLTQLYALRYGTVPVVRNTGGLADTVTDLRDAAKGVGFVFQQPHAGALSRALERALQHFSDRRGWRALQLRGMALNNGWDGAATHYRDIYRALRPDADTASFPSPPTMFAANQPA